MANPDADGAGALQLTDNGNSQVGSVFYQTALPTTAGLDFGFTSYQFNGSGADGIAFDLAAVDPSNPIAPTYAGATGGSLGYTLQGTVPGLPHGYMGIGLDVYGNYENTSYNGTCPTPSGINPGNLYQQSVTVRGPGNGQDAYCILKSSAQSAQRPGTNNLPNSSDTLSETNATSRSGTAVPVEVVINPTNTPVVASESGLAVPALSYLVAYWPIGESSWSAADSLTGPLPNTSNNAELANTADFPSSWINPATGIPYFLTFGWTASTGAANDFHQISNVTAENLGGALPILGLSSTDSVGGQIAPNENANIVLTPSVGASGTDESSPVTLSETFPSALTPGQPISVDPNWNCPAPVGQSIQCVYTPTSPIPAGSSLPSVVVPVVAANSLLGVGTQSLTAVVSALDAVPSSASDSMVFLSPSDHVIVTDDASQQLQASQSANFTFTPSVASPGLPESAPITMTLDFPSGITPGAPSFTDPEWSCGAPSNSGQSIPCTFTPTSAIAPGTQLSPIVVSGTASSVVSPGGSETVSSTVNSTDAPAFTASDVITTITAPGSPNGPAPTVSTVSSGGSCPFGVGVDASSNVFVSDYCNGAVTETSPGGSPSSVGSGWGCARGVSVDPNGNLFGGDACNGVVTEVTPANVVSTAASGFSCPNGVAVDAAGDVFAADPCNGTVTETAPGGSPVSIGGGWSCPYGVAVDAAGDVFVADNCSGRISELPVSGPQVSVGPSFNCPSGIAVDSYGDVYVSDGCSGTVTEFNLSGADHQVASGLACPYGVAVDSALNVYVADYCNSRVDEFSADVPAATPGAGSADVSWAPPSNDGGTPVSSYTVTADDLTNGAHGGQVCTYVVPGGGATETDTCTVAHLQPGDSYSFSVAATNVVGSGPASLPSLPTTILRFDQATLAVSSLSGTFEKPLALAATGGSGVGAVSFGTVNGSASGCLVTGSTLTSTSAGTCIVTATKGGDVNFNAASSSATAVTLAPGLQRALKVVAANTTFGTPLKLTTSGGSGTGVVTYKVRFGSRRGCKVVGATLTATRAGPCVVTATKAGDSNFVSLTSPPQVVLFQTVVVIEAFRPGRAVLTPAEITQLNALARLVIAEKALRVAVVGYGNLHAGKALCLRRAVMAQQYLALELGRLHDHRVVITAVSGGGTKKFGHYGSPLNRAIQVTIG